MSNKLFGYGGAGTIAALLAATAVSLGGGIATMAVGVSSRRRILMKEKTNDLSWLILLSALLLVASIGLGIFTADNINYRLKGVPLFKRG